MGRYTDEIETALESAAGAERPRERNDGRHVSTATPQAINTLRRQLKRLLEDLPDDLTILELREEIE